MIAFRDGDGSALQELMAECGHSMATVANRYLRDPHDVEDAVQEAWVAFARRAGAIESPQAIGGWLCITTAHAALAIARRRTRCSPTGTDFDQRAAEIDPIETVDVDRDREVAWVRDAVNRLAARDREMVRMLFVENLPYAAITARTGRATGGIGPTRGRLLGKLRADQTIRRLAATRVAPC